MQHMLYLLGASKQTTWEHEIEIPLCLYTYLPLKHYIYLLYKIKPEKSIYFSLSECLSRLPRTQSRQTVGS